MGPSGEVEARAKRVRLLVPGEEFSRRGQLQEGLARPGGQAPVRKGSRLLEFPARLLGFKSPRPRSRLLAWR